MIPAGQLPPGFPQGLDDTPAEPVEAKPAATVVLLRQGAAGVEVFLMRRNRSSGFVPGAYVFPGGRVDAADALPELRPFVEEEPVEPPLPYWLAAVREVFEETGVFLGEHAAAMMETGWRNALLEDRATLLDVLRATGARIRFDRIVYFAHWITPLAEPRRFDTRFFAAELPPGADARADPREMSDALWLTPRLALQRFDAAGMPMVFPTVRTLEAIEGLETVDDVLAALRHASVKPILPRLVRTDEGVTILVDETEAGGQ
jgi:8-oxo-dGTP pyrophosphatase MutT (NUDIX family)